MREALTSDPSILRDAVAALRADESRKQEEEARAAVDKARPALFGAPDDPVAGNPQGEVTLVEFYDLHCPYCRRMLPVTQALVAAEPRLRIVFKDIPILGPGSMLGARAVLAAQRQDGYLQLQGAIMAGPGGDHRGVGARGRRQGRAGLGAPARRHGRPRHPGAHRRQPGAVAVARRPGHAGLRGGRCTLFSGAMPLDQLKAAIAAARARG